jgi:hypothetical protein
MIQLHDIQNAAEADGYTPQSYLDRHIQEANHLANVCHAELHNTWCVVAQLNPRGVGYFLWVYNEEVAREKCRLWDAIIVHTAVAAKSISATTYCFHDHMKGH